MTLSHFAVLLAAIAPLAFVNVARAQGPTPRLGPRVDVEGGAIVGVQTGELMSYKGVPFAAPPVRVGISIGRSATWR